MENVRRFVTVKGSEARSKLLKGVEFGADAVRRTLGPHGRNWVSGVRGGTPHITNDGVTILKQLWLPDEIEMLGLRAARESALKVNDKVGDGTTTVMLLTSAILEKVSSYLGTGVIVNRKSPMDLKRQIDSECLLVIDALKEMATPVNTRESLIASAKVASEDDTLAEMIGGTQWDLGPDGTILVEDTAEPTDSIERINGVRIDHGFSVSRVINNQEKQRLELTNVHVIFTNKIIKTLGDFRAPNKTEGAGILDVLLENKIKAVVIVAKAFSNEAMVEIAQNMKQGFAIYPINAPYFDQAEIMRDMAAVLGGTFIDTEERDNLQNMTLSDVGFASNIEAARWNATFAGVKDERSENRIKARIEVLTKKLKGEVSEFHKKALQSRIAQLKNGFALMKVGALSEAEQKRKRDKVDDTVNATKAALQEGTVAGAGLALKQIAEKMDDESILKEPLGKVYAQIMENAGSEFEVPAWVRDPVKVLRIVIESACSVAGNLATAEGAIDHENPKARYIEESSDMKQQREEDNEE